MILYSLPMQLMSLILIEDDHYQITISKYVREYYSNNEKPCFHRSTILKCQDDLFRQHRYMLHKQVTDKSNKCILLCQNVHYMLQDLLYIHPCRIVSH